MRKRILATGLILAMLVSASTDVKDIDAKGKTALAKKTITLKKGKTFLLKLKNNKKKVKWSVDKKKIVKLSKKTRKSVMLKALKTGKAKVIAKIGKKKYTCRVIVPAQNKEDKRVPQGSQVPTTKAPVETEKKQETKIPGIKETASPAATPKLPSTSMPVETEKPAGETITIRGSVTDAKGTPLTGVKIGFCRVDYDGDYTVQFSATSDEKGNYEVDGMEKGKKYSAHVYVMDKPDSDDWGVSAGTIMAGDSSTYAIKVTMELTKVSGSLTDLEGDPLMNLKVRLYESSEERDKDESVAGFDTGDDGTYSQWFPKNKNYYVKIYGNGNEYYPENLNSSYAKQDLKINENLVEVVSSIKDKSGITYRDEWVDLEITPKGENVNYIRSLQINRDGQICISMSEASVCKVKIRIDGVTYFVGTIKAGQKDTYNLLFDAVIKEVNITLLYANQQVVDEFSIIGTGLNVSPFWKGKNGKCSMRLKEGATWGLKAYVHGRTYNLDNLKVGDESTYKKQLAVSLKKFSGSLQTKDGTKLPKASVYFYDDPEMKSSVYNTTTDDDGQYEIWSEEGKTYYASVQVSGVKYNIGKVQDNYNLTLDANLEKVKLEVKNSEGTAYITWNLYENENGKKGTYIGAFFDSSILLLQTGKKYYVEVRSSFLADSDAFIAGSFTVGDEKTYTFIVDEVKVNGAVKDSAGNVITGANIVGTDDFMDLQTGKYKVFVKFKNTVDGTQKSTEVDREDGKYTINLIKGQKYSVNVVVAGKTYEIGTIIADQNKESNITINAQLAAIHGKITDVNGEIIKAKKVCFYEDKEYKTLAYEGTVTEDGTYGLYVDSGKTYYVQVTVPKGDSAYSSYTYVSIGSIAVTENGTVDLKSSKMRVSGKVTDADGNALSNRRIRCYEKESDTSSSYIDYVYTDSKGRYSLWLEPGTYNVRAEIPYRKDYQEDRSVGNVDTSDKTSYDLKLNMRKITGKITGISKEVLAECDLRLYDNETAENSKYIDWITPEEDGTYQTKIYVEDDTRYYLRFGDDDYVSIGSVLSGDESTYDINIDQSFEKVSGKATFSDGSFIDNGYVCLYDKESDSNRKDIGGYDISEGGVFETAFLQVGTTYYCEIYLDGIYYKSGSITVGDRATYNLTMEKTLKCVSITVKDTQNTVLDDLSVCILESGGEAKQICDGETSENGVFVSNYLELGKSYVVRIMICNKEYYSNTFTIGKENQYEVKINANLKKAEGTVKKADNKLVKSGCIYLYESSDDDDYDYKEYVEISDSKYSDLWLESGKTYYVRVTDYSDSEGDYYRAGVITGGEQSTYEIKIQE